MGTRARAPNSGGKADTPVGSLRNLLFALTAVLSGAIGHAASIPQQEYTEALASSVDRARGQQLFQSCAACHGVTGAGSTDGLVPAIAAQHFRVLVKQLVDYRYSKRWDPRMESVARGHLLPDTSAIAAVATYVSELPRPPVLALGDGENAVYGGQVYRRLCASCHGNEGQGDASKGIPRIAGQHYDYLLRQLYDAIDKRRPNFSTDHVRLLKRFQYADFVGVSDYIARLGVQ